MSRSTTFKAAIVIVLPLLGLAGCTDLKVPEGLTLTCSGDGDCPEGYGCRADVGLCLSGDVLAKTPISVVGDAVVSREVLSYAPGFSTTFITVTFSEAPPGLPWATFDGRHDLPCLEAPAGAPTYECSFDLAQHEGETSGSFDIVVNAIDEALNVASARVWVGLDVKAPELVPGTDVVFYSAHPGSAVLQPAALGWESDLVLQLSISEAPAGTPYAIIDTETLAGRPQLSLDTARSAGTLLVLTLDSTTIQSGAPLDDGLHDVVIEVEDAVGNRGEIRLADAVAADFNAPDAVDTSTADQVRFSRAPWGTSASPNAFFSVVGAAGSAEPGASLHVTTGEAFDSSLLAVGEVGSDGSFDLSLNPVDVPRVWLHAVDAAGNVGAPARVRDIQWTASLGGKVDGTQLGNPHAVYGARRFDPSALFANLAVEAPGGGGLVEGSTSLEVQAGSVFGLTQPRSTGAPELGEHAFAYFPPLGGSVAFGGKPTVTTDAADTYLLQGGIWSEIAAQGGPRGGPALMTYERAPERLLLFDGNGDTWFFHGTSWVPFGGEGPPARTGGALVYDEVGDRTLLFGGAQGVDRLADLWVFEGNAWREIDATGPAARQRAVLGFDRAAGRVILLGGDVEGGALADDAWWLDGETWTQAAGTVAGYGDCRAATHGTTGRVWLTGCRAGGGREETALYWDGSALVAGPVQPHGGGSANGMVWDDAGQRLLIHGGLDADFYVPGTRQSSLVHVLEDGGDAWVELVRDPARMPDMRPNSLFWEPDREEVIFCGGDNGNAPFFELWGFDGQSAAQLEPGFPPVTSGFYDGDGILGAGADRFYRWTEGGGWAQLTDADPTHPSGMSAAYMPASGDVLLFGGSLSAMLQTKTWRLDGAVRTEVVTTETPTARAGGTLVWDEHDGRAVLVGGLSSTYERLLDTWVFENDQWRRIGDLPDLERISAAYDPARGRTVAVGGWNRDSTLLQLLGDEWVEADVEMEPVYGVVPAWDGNNQQLIFHGGTTGALYPTDDSWGWDGGRLTRAGLVFEWQLIAAGAAPDAVVERLEVDAVGGGRGWSKGTSGADAVPVAGLELLGWGSGWVSLATGTQDADAAAAFSHTVDDAATLSRVLRDQTHLALLAPATGPGGDDGSTSRLSAAAFEVTLRYREP
jgi:hypothetical protein